MAVLPLYHGVKGKRSVVNHAIVPDHLFEDIAEFHKHGWSPWKAEKSRTDYAYCVRYRSGVKSKHWLHRVVWEMENGPIPDDLMIDHIDQNGLNCSLDNLRLATGAQNTCNQTKRRRRDGSASPEQKYKGVRRRKVRESAANPWESRIRSSGELIALGHYRDEDEAAFAFNVAADRLYGEFACTNALPVGCISDERMTDIASRIHKIIDQKACCFQEA